MSNADKVEFKPTGGKRRTSIHRQSSPATLFHMSKAAVDQSVEVFAKMTDLQCVQHMAKVRWGTGADITPEHLPRLFDRFYRADKARTHAESDGAGLGLAITRAIVEAHGGKASVRSANGKTTFELEFKQVQ